MIPGSANPLLLKSAAAAAGYQIERSLRFNSSDSASLSRASYAGSGTFSCWVKRCKLGTAQTIISGVAFNASDQLNSSTAVFRDPSAWMHVLVSTSGTYVNGTSVASGSAITPGIIGSGCDLYLADIYFIDGQALTPSSFTEVSATTGQLIPKAYAGTYTGNSFWLKFNDNSAATATTLGKDSFLLGNNWTPNNLSVTAGAGNDSLVDTPTSYGTDTGAGGQVRGNYATLNPLKTGDTTSFAQGNLFWRTTSNGPDRCVLATIGMSSGKWYWECYMDEGTATAVGIALDSVSLTTGGAGSNSYVYYSIGTYYNSGSSTGSPSSFTTGDLIGVAFDADTGKLWFAKNGTWQSSGDPGAGTNPAMTLTTGLTYFPLVGDSGGVSQSQVTANFGQRAFAYTAPSGFKALVDTNLTAPVVAKPNTVMDVVLYSGTGSNQTITGLNFNPDFVWLKRRSSAQAHYLYDVIRGTSSVLYSDGTDAEQSISTGLTAFNSNGFSLGSLSGVNASSTTNVAWTWDAGSSTVSNTSGSITSQVRANASAGFSVVTYTATGSTLTVGHGLGVAPELIIIKGRTSTASWAVYTKAVGTSAFLLLNTTAAVQNFNVWNNTSPTSTVFTVGAPFDEGNTAGVNHVAYCFAPVVGYSSFGSYVGNGSASDNTFVYTGMRPRFVMLKRSDSTGNWVIWDAVRNSYNVANSILLPNSSAAEYSPDAKIDILSNGFKVRDNSSDSGTNGATYIYAAFAESPLQYSRAR